MKYVRQAAPLVVGSALLLLIYTGALDLSRAVWLGIAVEVGLWLLGARTVLRVMRRIRRERAAGLDGWEALEHGLAEVLPRRVATLMLAGLRMYRALARWTARKTRRQLQRRRRESGSR